MKRNVLKKDIVKDVKHQKLYFTAKTDVLNVLDCVYNSSLKSQVDMLLSSFTKRKVSVK